MRKKWRGEEQKILVHTSILVVCDTVNIIPSTVYSFCHLSPFQTLHQLKTPNRDRVS